MKIILILIFLVVGIPILKAMGQAVKKTKEQNRYEEFILRSFLKAVQKSDDAMDMNFDLETAKILDIRKEKVFKLFGRMISSDDVTGYYKGRYEKYGVKNYIDEIITALEDIGQFKSINKVEKDLMKATETGEARNYKYKYNVEKWVIDTNTTFYIVLSTFTEGRASYFAFGMVDY